MKHALQGIENFSSWKNSSKNKGCFRSPVSNLETVSETGLLFPNLFPKETGLVFLWETELETGLLFLVQFLAETEVLFPSEIGQRNGTPVSVGKRSPVSKFRQWRQRKNFGNRNPVSLSCF